MRRNRGEVGLEWLMIPPHPTSRFFTYGIMIVYTHNHTYTHTLQHIHTASWSLQDYDDPTQQKPLVLHQPQAQAQDPSPSAAPTQSTPIPSSSTATTSSPSALLSEQAMEDAIYTALNPTVAAAAALYPSLPGVTKAQRKAFAKFIKFYMRDQVGLWGGGYLLVVWCVCVSMAS
jgi:hypothetical protein